MCKFSNSSTLTHGMLGTAQESFLLCFPALGKPQQMGLGRAESKGRAALRAHSSMGWGAGGLQDPGCQRWGEQTLHLDCRNRGAWGRPLRSAAGTDTTVTQNAGGNVQPRAWLHKWIQGSNAKASELLLGESLSGEITRCINVSTKLRQDQRPTGQGPVPAVQLGKGFHFMKSV